MPGEITRMAMPEVLNEAAYVHVWTGQLNVAGRGTMAHGGAVVGGYVTGGAVIGGAIKNKRFLTYVEVSEQGAHDPAMRSMAQARHLQVRPMHAGRVAPLNPGNATTAAAYYAVHGQMVAGLVAAYMTSRWTRNATNNTVFKQGTPTPLGIQGTQQNNGFYYEVTMWYDVADVYAAFHCYA